MHEQSAGARRDDYVLYGYGGGSGLLASDREITAIIRRIRDIRSMMYVGVEVFGRHAQGAMRIRFGLRNEMHNAPRRRLYCLTCGYRARVRSMCENMRLAVERDLEAAPPDVLAVLRDVQREERVICRPVRGAAHRTRVVRNVHVRG